VEDGRRIGKAGSGHSSIGEQSENGKRDMVKKGKNIANRSVMGIQTERQ
jgi:hypothetical protein